MKVIETHILTHEQLLENEELCEVIKESDYSDEMFPDYGYPLGINDWPTFFYIEFINTSQGWFAKRPALNTAWKTGSGVIYGETLIKVPYQLMIDTLKKYDI